MKISKLKIIKEDWFIWLLALFLYLNFGSWLFEQYDKARYYGKGSSYSNILMPIVHMANLDEGDEVVKKSTNDYDEFQQKRPLRIGLRVAATIFWPALFLVFTSWQWLVYALYGLIKIIYFIFFGGLLNFIFG